MHSLGAYASPGIPRAGFGRGLGRVANVAQPLRVGLNVQATSPQRDDVVAYGDDLDVTPGAERLPPRELVASLL